MVGGARLIFRRLLGVDLAVLVPTLLLMLAGLLLIRSATHTSGNLQWRQLQWFAIAGVISIPLILIPYPRILRFGGLFYIAGMALLLLLRFFGPLRNHARRWFVVGDVLLQPSEIMKLCVVLALARMLRFGRPLSSYRTWLPILILGLMPISLIIIQPDLGTSLLFVPLTLAVLLVSGIPLRSFMLILLCGALAVTGGWFFVLKDYQRERIWSTYNHHLLTESQRAGPGYQLTQSLLAISDGGTMGHGHAQGPQTQAGLVPLDYNDFIFAVVAEEHGMLGCTLILFLYLALVAGILRVSAVTRDPSGRLICVGVAALLGAQALVHMAVTLGLAPTTGMPLPLVSYGGSSLLVTAAGLALVHNVAINRPRAPITGGMPSFQL